MTPLTAAQWAAALDPDKIAHECSPVHIANVLRQARDHIIALSKEPKRAAKRATPKIKTKPEQHVFTAAHHKAAARQGATPEKLIATQMAALRRRATAPEARAFPKSSAALNSTAAYVREYYTLNQLGYRENFFQPLNDQPTTWPSGPGLEDVTNAQN